MAKLEAMASTTSLLSSRAATSSAPEKKHVLLALGALWIVWGSTYLAMRIAVETLPPLAMGGVRFVVAGSILLLALRKVPRLRDWLLAVPLGFLLFLIGNGLVVVAEKTVPSSFAAIACSTTPLLASGIGAVRGERPSWRELVGMMLGIGGVVVLAGGSLRETGIFGLLVLLAPVGWSIGSMIARAKGATALSAAATHMITGGAWMLIASVVVGESYDVHPSTRSLVAWLWLIVLGSLVGFSAYLHLLRHARPAVAMSYAYVNPVIAVILGAIIGGETIGWSTALATILIASGVAIGMWRRRA